MCLNCLFMEFSGAITDRPLFPIIYYQKVLTDINGEAIIIVEAENKLGSDFEEEVMNYDRVLGKSERDR